MQPINLEITPEIIAVAVQRDSGHCVVADALKAARPDLQRLNVDLQTIRATDPVDGTRYLWFTPAAAQSILVNFDQGLRPEPQVIRLGRPCQVIRKSKQARANARRRALAYAERIRASRVDQRESRGPDVDSNRPYLQPGYDQGQPIKMDGTPPPVAALASTRGRRRTFGLRSLRA